MPLPPKRRQQIPKPPPSAPTIGREIDPGVFSGYERFANMKEKEQKNPKGGNVGTVGVQG